MSKDLETEPVTEQELGLRQKIRALESTIAAIRTKQSKSVNKEPENHAAALAAVNKWLDWARGARPPAEQIVADVVLAYAEGIVPNGIWFPISSLPEGRHVLLYWPCGEQGVGGMECAMVFRSGDEWSYWTHGGPNSGSDWGPMNDEKPTHWMPLPEPPAS